MLFLCLFFLTKYRIKVQIPLGFDCESELLASSIRTDELSVTVEEWEPAIDSDNREYFNLPFE